MSPINWHTVLFLVAALVSCGFALGVVLSGNIVRMALYLVASLAGVAGLFFLAGADFVGGMQLMIYVGGTLVLLVFGVMLTARGPFITMQTGGGQWILAVIVAGALMAVLLQGALSVNDWYRSEEAAKLATPMATPTAAPLGLSLVGVRPDQLGQKDATLRRGMAAYVLPFEIISVHLVVVLIAAAYLARAKKRRAMQADELAAAREQLEQSELAR